VIGFSVEVEEKNNYPIVHIKGEIDVYTCPALQEKLNEIINRGELQVVLDLEDLQYIDSTGLGTIANTAQNIQDQNGEVHVICNKPQIKKIFEFSGLEEKNITLYDTKSELVKKLG
tara:strand:- start:118 stop:465 length:348 start_codon:yes stop_codon:yes gene_type:complete